MRENGGHASTRPLRDPMKATSEKPGSVRIIGGRWRGTKLPVPGVSGLRPTPDRVRETVFNWLQPVLPGARVLDLFAGSGAFGLESLSRGAREALLVENDARACEALRATVARLAASAEAHVHQADALALLRAPMHGRFDIVFLDPPFAARSWEPALAALQPWVGDDAWLYLESPRDHVPPVPPDWIPHRESSTREVRYALYRRVARSPAGAG